MSYADAFKLIDAIAETFSNAVTGDFRKRTEYMPVHDNPLTPENEARTYCNFAVNDIAKAMGCGELAGMLANKMVEKMQKSENFSPVLIDEAQAHANSGYLVVAGVIDLPHGHVVVVRPGKETFSSKWNKMVPRVVNVGASNFINHSLSYAFKEEPQLFVWKGPLTVHTAA